MSGYLTLYYAIGIIVGALVLIFFNEVHVGYLEPLTGDFTGESDLENYGNLFMTALIPMTYFIALTLWYITAMQRRRSLYA